ncbi:MAG: hypothetical protein ACTSPK_05180 [Candidatus Heimdallarchaeota archaeon]
MSSRGGLNALTVEGPKSAKKPAFTKVVKESLKSIILSGESQLGKYVSHRTLYFYGFLTGWNERIFSIELVPIFYFLIWSIVLFALKETSYGLLYLFSALIILIYFIFLHTLISTWDRIRHYFIRLARKQNGIDNMTLEDVRSLLNYTKKVFGVKTKITAEDAIVFNPDKLRKGLVANKRWRFSLNVVVILSLFLFTGAGIFGAVKGTDFLVWLGVWWYLVLIPLIPIIIASTGMILTKNEIRKLINHIPEDDFVGVLKILSEFEILGGTKSQSKND